MDDLISRKAVIDGMNEYLNQPIHRGNRRWTKGCEAVALDLLFTINGTPSVPAVPLDKLCEFLAKHAQHPWCIFWDNCPSCECHVLPFEAETRWKHVLKTWMEGLDAAD